MKLIDKLLIKAKLNRGKMYLLIGIVRPENGLFHLELNLHKFGECIRSYERRFDSKEETEKFIGEICSQYSLEEDDVLTFFIDYGEESG